MMLLARTTRSTLSRSSLIRQTRTIYQDDIPGATVYVGNIPWSTTRDDLRPHFAAFGEIESIRVVSDRETGRPKGFGFVTFSTTESADAAVDALNGQDFQGRELRVSIRKPRENTGYNQTSEVPKE